MMPKWGINAAKRVHSNKQTSEFLPPPLPHPRPHLPPPLPILELWYKHYTTMTRKSNAWFHRGLEPKMALNFCNIRVQEFLPSPLPHPPHVDKRSKLRRHEVIQHGRRPKTGSSLGSLTIHRNTIHGPQAPPQAPQAPPLKDTLRPFKVL